MDIKKLVTWVVGAAALTLAACGGGGSSGGIGGTGGGSGGIGGTGVAYGTITDFGSVWVNGVEYNSGNATIRIDDTVHPESDLRRGMVVRVDGSVSGATASTITVDDAVKGLVEQVIDANRMVVMGQTVQIDNLTRFDNNVVPVQGDRVEVHGLIAGDGLIAAGYIEKKATAPTPPFAVKGVVKNHDSTAQTFQVGTLTVQYSGTTVVSDMPGGPWNGLQVDVKGTACSGTAPVCGTLTASKVEPAGASVSSASQAEIEGIVVAVTVNGFTIGNQTVVTTASTRYEGGVAGDIAAGTKLEAEGSISGGVLTATKVSFRDAIRIEADVATVNAGAGTLTLAGLPGVTVNVNSLTDYKGGPTLSGLAAPNHLRIRGRLATGNSVIATELEQRSTSSDSRVILQAAATAVTAPNLTLLGIVVDTTAVSDNNFHDVTDAPIGRTAFFTAAKVGTLIKARGTNAAGSVTWDQMELEN